MTRSGKMLELVHSDVMLVGERKAGDLLLSAAFLAEPYLNRLWMNKEIKLFEFNKVLYYSLRQKENKERIERA